MAIVQTIRTYFKAERLESVCIFALGLLAATGSGIIYKMGYNNGLPGGLFWPLAFLACFGLGTGGFNFLNNNQRIKLLDTEFKKEPTVYLTEERVRMQRLLKLNIPFLIFWTLLIVTGLVMALWPENFIRGIGIGLIAIGIAGHTIDFFAGRRNRNYAQKLEDVKFK